jgi:hypothetical protein
MEPPPHMGSSTTSPASTRARRTIAAQMVGRSDVGPRWDTVLQQPHNYTKKTTTEKKMYAEQKRKN